MNVKKGSRPSVFLALLTSKCASRHNRVHFFDIWTSKSGPNVSFWQFWLGNVLRATTACTIFDISTSKGGLTWVCFVTWKCASGHNSVHFFDSSTFKSAPKLRCFVHFDFAPQTACNFSSLIWPDGSAPAALASLLFDHPEPQIIGTTRWIATFLPFRVPASSFFSLFLFSALLTFWLLLSDSSHLCLSICAYCRKFDFKTSIT